MKIEFDVYPAKINDEANGVRYYSVVDGKKTNCLISEEALGLLEDPESDEEKTALLEAFQKHKPTIEKKAAQMIEAG